jgi:hypothetical protein
MNKIATLLSEGNDEQVKKDFISPENNMRQSEYLYAELLYAPYQNREKREIEKAIEFRDLVIPTHFVYAQLPGLSIELQQKLEKIKPATIAQASLIQGMTPAALSLLILIKAESASFDESCDDNSAGLLKLCPKLLLVVFISDGTDEDLFNKECFDLLIFVSFV